MAKIRVKHLLDKGLDPDEAEAAREADAKNRGVEGELIGFSYDPETGYGRAKYGVSDTEGHGWDFEESDDD